MMTHNPGQRHLWPNFVFVFALIAGAWAYLSLPRAQYPEVKLNWVAVATVWPTASARDVEQRITLPLEAVVRRVGQVRYVAATSRDHISTLLIRFEDVSHAGFEQHLQNLNREIQQAAVLLPKEARAPQVVELTSSSIFPTAMVAVSLDSADGEGRRLVRTIQSELEALPGVEKVWAIGMRERELEVAFDAAALQRHGVSPETLARTLSEQAQDVPAGGVRLSDRLYNARVLGLPGRPDLLAALPIQGSDGVPVALGDLARVRFAASPVREGVMMAGEPAVLLSVIKRENINTLQLTDRIRAYVQGKNRQLGRATVLLADDQSGATRGAIHAMENNALLGLATVVLVAWLFLGRRMALLVSVGVPFALAAMFLALYGMGETLNTSVLLGVAIVLGIPLDDAVVVAEAIQMRLNQGVERLDAVRLALQEVARPVTASVLATVVAFAPLLWLPGLLGKFMLVVPLTVILTLLASMAASLWILPSHVTAWRGREICPLLMRRLRLRVVLRLRLLYGRLLARSFRHPAVVAVVFLGLAGLSALGVGAGWMRVQWFASDPLRVFNLNVQLPATASLEETLAATRRVESRLREVAGRGEIRASLAVAGLQFTPSETLHGDHLGQVMVSLSDQDAGGRGVGEFIADARPGMSTLSEVGNVTFQMLSADLPSLSALTIRLTGASGDRLAAAAQELHQAMNGIAGIKDVRDDAELGKPQLTLHLDPAAAVRAGLDPMKVAAMVRLHFDGLPLAGVRDGEDTVSLVLRAQDKGDAALRALLEQPWRLASGQSIRPAELFALEFETAASQSRRVNYRPAVSLYADLERGRLSAEAAESRITAAWKAMRARHPGVAIEFGGELEDVRQSLHDLERLFVLGVALMCTLLAIQFRSLILPLLMLATAPMALIGVVLGLMASGQPLTLYTLYGGVALSGVAVNAAIVLIAAARDRTEAGMPPLQAAFHAARRRLIPIVITTLSILGGLVSLAFGLGGQSLLWGPLAAAIVWGLVVATPLTLFATPLLYYRLARGRVGR